MVKKKIIEINGTPGPIKNPKMLRVRYFLDLFVITLVVIDFLLFVFVIISPKVFLSLLIFSALYTYVARRFI